MDLYFDEKYNELMFESIEPDTKDRDEYPPYISEAVSDGIEKIKAISGKTVNFAFMTDNHYAVSRRIRLRRSLNAYKSIEKAVGLDFLCLGGDHTNEGTKRHKKECLSDFKSELSGIRFFPINGNHDDGTIWNTAYGKNEESIDYMLPCEQYDIFYSDIEKNGASVNCDVRDGLYYYYNDEKNKIRYIFLNNMDIPYIKVNNRLKYIGQSHRNISQKQFLWLINDALVFKEEGWAVIFIGHLFPADSESFFNTGNLQKLICAYNEGRKFSAHNSDIDFSLDIECDFSEYKRAEIIMYLYGHEHLDSIKKIDGINYVSTSNAAMHFYLPEHWERKDGDKTEILFDIVSVDRKNRKVYFTRIGAGKDREIFY